jgi:L-rhamnose 1-dehydrogenase
MHARADVSQEPGLEPQSTAWQRFALDGQVAIVTGAAGALGSAISMGLAQHGADVALTDLRAEAAKEVAQRVAVLGGKTYTIPCDVRDAEQVAAAVAGTIEALGRVDIVVHTAGVARLTPLVEMPLEQFQQTLLSCLTGGFLVCRAAAKQMIRQGDGGSMVVVSSIASARALGRGTGAYAAAKAGLNAMVRELAVELAPHGIRVNAVAPCQFMTPSLKVVLNDTRYGGPEELSARMLARIPVGRFGQPEDLVGPCVFLASRAASMVTGQVLFVDGGYTAQ